MNYSELYKELIGSRYDRIEQIRDIELGRGVRVSRVAIAADLSKNPETNGRTESVPCLQIQ